MRRWALPAILSWVAGVSVWAATAPVVAPVPSAAVLAPRAPVLSPRRLPAVLAALAGEARLRSDLAALATDTRLAGGRETCVVVSDGTRSLFEHKPGLSLVPASTTKLLTAAAVLHRLGPTATLATSVVTPAPLVDGVAGDLWLVGGGDPLLAVPEYTARFTRQPQPRTRLEDLADRLVFAGLRRVQGRLLGDDSRHDRIRYLPSWKPVYITDNETGPLSALSVNDGFTSWRPQPLLAAPDPAAQAAAVLADLLRRRGVVVGGTGVGTAPQGATVLATQPSLPMAEVVAEMLRESDNQTAELLVRELGARAGEGTTGAGLAEVRVALTELGLPLDGFVAFDGSGLDRGNRATCRLLLSALLHPGVGPALVPGLPVAASTGTLAHRFAGTPAAGRVRAKTGSLNGVAGLVGTVPTHDGRLLGFAFLTNGFVATSTGVGAQDRLVSILATYPNGPSEAAIAP